MPNEQIWIKAEDVELYHEVLEKLVVFYEEAINSKPRIEHSGFDPNPKYQWDAENKKWVYRDYFYDEQKKKWVETESRHKKGRRSRKEEIGTGYVVMQALKEHYQKIYLDLTKSPEMWASRPDTYSFLLDFMKTGIEPWSAPTAQVEPVPSFEEWLKSKGLENTLDNFKEYNSEFPNRKKHEWVKKNP